AALLAAAAPAGALAAAPPAVYGVSVTAAGPVSAVVSWQTSTPARSWVELGTSSPFGVWVPGSTSPARTHRATLTGLSPTTGYALKIVALDARGRRGEIQRALRTTAIPANTNAATRGNTIVLD